MSSSAALRQAAQQLEAAAADARHQVQGLADRAGPHVWEGVVPRQVRAALAEATTAAHRGADQLEQAALLARRQAHDLDAAEALAGRAAAWPGLA